MNSNIFSQLPALLKERARRFNLTEKEKYTYQALRLEYSRLQDLKHTLKLIEKSGIKYKALWLDFVKEREEIGKPVKEPFKQYFYYNELERAREDYQTILKAIEFTKDRITKNNEYLIKQGLKS